VANSKSALKRAIQAEQRRDNNRQVRSAIRTYTNKFEAAIAAGVAADAESAYRAISSELDRAARKGVIPKERADRKKGRMAVRLAAI